MGVDVGVAGSVVVLHSVEAACVLVPVVVARHTAPLRALTRRHTSLGHRCAPRGTVGVGGVCQCQSGCVVYSFVASSRYF